MGCMEQSIQDIKDEIVPASFFVLFLVVYFLVVIIWNNIMIGNDDLEGLTKIIGLVFNGVLVLFSLVLTILGLVGYFGIECPNDTDCRPTSLVILILLGVSTLAVSGATVAGIQLNNNILLRIGTLVMCFVVIFLIMAGIVMGMSSGAVMDDMNFYYDTQYPKLRAALERADSRSPTTPGYCQMKKDDCTALTLSGTAVFPTDQDKEKIEGSTAITKAAMWKMQWNEASKAAAAEKPKTWLGVCESTGICIYCEDFEKAAQDTKLVNTNDTSLAPNINFQAAVNGFACKSKSSGTISPVDSAKVVQFTQDMHWQKDIKDSKFIGMGCPDGSEPVPRNWTIAKGQETTNPTTPVIANYKAIDDKSKSHMATRRQRSSKLRNPTSPTAKPAGGALAAPACRSSLVGAPRGQIPMNTTAASTTSSAT